jgi:pyruvate formate lyase activating enzyme
MRDVPATPAATLSRAAAIARGNGVRYAYTGNVHDEQGGSTFCHACGTRLIGRDWYRLTDWGLGPDGCCRQCGTRCAGVFAAEPGRWGARRLPVRLGSFGL